MDWNGKHERQAMKRIVALLFALGLLAERTAAKPRPLRAALLWLLRAAETIARDFVLEQFQEKREPAFRPELRKDKKNEQFQEKREPAFRPELRKDKKIEQFQEKWEPVFRPELRKNKSPAMVEDFGGRSGLPASPPAHDVADDAIRLARSFRALAELLTDLMRRSPALVPSARARRSIRDLPRGLRNLADKFAPGDVCPGAARHVLTRP